MTVAELERWHSSAEGQAWAQVGRALARGDNAGAFQLLASFMPAELALRCLLEFA